MLIQNRTKLVDFQEHCSLSPDVVEIYSPSVEALFQSHAGESRCDLYLQADPPTPQRHDIAPFKESRAGLPPDQLVKGARLNRSEPFLVGEVRAPRRAPAKFLVFNVKFLVSNTQFIICTHAAPAFM